MEPSKEKLLTFFKRAPVTVKLKLFGVGALALLTVVGSISLVVGILRFNLRQEKVPNRVPTATKEIIADPFSITYELKDISVSLADKAGSRVGYAQFNLVLDLPTAEAKHRMELNHAKLLDSLQDVVNEFSLEDVKTGEGIQRFKERLLQVYREKFSDSAPRELAFKDFILN